MKNKLNQAFTTFDFIITSVSVVVIFVISGPILLKSLQSGNIEKAQKDTREIAYELLNAPDSSALRLASASMTLAKGARTIASVGDTQGAWQGSTKRDPWGNPYRFRFLRNAKGMPVELVVWSEGPEKKTELPPVKVSSTDGMEKVDFAPDDVVSVFPIR